MGIPYRKTEDVNEAIQFKIIYTSSYIGIGTLTPLEKKSITDYISSGGVIVSTNVSDSDLYTLFGITGELRLNTRYSLIWQINVVEPALKYIDDPKEETVSLGSKTYSGIIYTRGYSTGRYCQAFCVNSLSTGKLGLTFPIRFDLQLNSIFKEINARSL